MLRSWLWTARSQRSHYFGDVVVIELHFYEDMSEWLLVAAVCTGNSKVSPLRNDSCSPMTSPNIDTGISLNCALTQSCC